MIRGFFFRDGAFPRKGLALSFLLIVLAAGLLPARAQRLLQPLSRSVVAVLNGNNVGISWRLLAQDAPGVQFNLYKRNADGSDFQKINQAPLSATCYQTTIAEVPYNTQLAVSSITGGVESDLSAPFLFKKQAWSNVFFDFNFETAVLQPNDYRCKYAWPMDLDGSGKVDAVLVDRLYQGTGGENHKLQAYLLDGTCLWTIDMGPNINLCAGQNDMVTVYDINCDGKCEVIVKSSDGTRFWDAAGGTWGKYAMGSDVADTDGDGVTDYRESSTKNPPFYISVVNARTGAEMDCAEIKYDELTDGVDQYSRDNKADYMESDDRRSYAFMESKFVIAYFDGIHPSLGVETYNRTKDKTHHYYMLSWGYDWQGGTPSNWHHNYTWSRNDKQPYPAEFHQLRVADVDGDGIDEVLEGGFGVNPVKGMVYSAGIGHGDRFDVSDIDPDRPGMEVFAIQQSDLLGQVLYDAATGEHIKEWYLPSVYDVGRGRCIDVDSTVRGYEIYSMLPNLYDCKGNVIKEGDTPFPQEAIWWDGDLQRELIGSPGGSDYGTNVMVQKYDGTRLIQFSKESDWAVHSATANRPAFMGDITGDWREEIILMKQNAETSTGLVGYATHLPTDYSFYTLQQDPHYRLDCTGRGYYQAPNTGFYLGGEMPMPPLPPVVQAQLRWQDGGVWDNGQAGFADFTLSASCSYADGKSVMFDVGGLCSSPILVQGAVEPAAVYLMNPKGHDYTFTGDGCLAGAMTLWKSMQGTATFNIPLEHTGTTVISEGTLAVNGRMAGAVNLCARGTLSGNATLADTIVFEGALNHEGCRLLMATVDDSITFERSLTLPGNVYVELAAAEGKCGRLVVKGDLRLRGKNFLTVNAGQLAEGDYVIAACEGQLDADVSQIGVRGLQGYNYDLVAEPHRLLLRVNATRAPAVGVVWTGAQGSEWNYKTRNFLLQDTPVAFVTGDGVVFNDDSSVRNVVVDEMLPVSGVTFDVNSGVYTFTGSGGFSGTGSLVKNGKGEVSISLDANDYTGATIINDGILTVTSLNDGGTNSCLGAAPATEGYLQMNGGTLKVKADNVATDRVITLNDTSSIVVATASGSVSLKGQVRGDGFLIKDGDGQLNFNYGGTNPFGGMKVCRGVVAQGAWNSTFGKASSPLVLEGGEVHLIKMNDSSRRPILNQSVRVPQGAKAVIRGTTRGAINGSVSGSGQLTIVSDGVRNDIGADFSRFEGTLVAEGENFRLMDGVKDMSRLSLKMSEGCVIGHYASNGGTAKAVTTTVGSLASSAVCTLGNGQDTYHIGSNNASTIFNGMFKAASIVKKGNGILTLRSEGSTSPIQVNEGELRVSNVSTTASLVPVTSGTITINSGAMLSGSGCVSVVVANKGAVVKGGSILPGELMVVSSLTLNAGSTLLVVFSDKSYSKNSRFYVQGNVTHNQDTILLRIPEGYEPVAGEEYSVFTGSGKQSGSYVLKTDCEDFRVTWDDSRLLSEGIIKVSEVVSTGIKAIGASSGSVQVYSVSGELLRKDVPEEEALQGLPAGVYVVNGKKIRKQ